MKKTVCLVTMFIIFLLPNTILAHTYLKDSSPHDGEVVVEQVQEIELLFETKIENQSRFQVTNGQGDIIDIDNIVIEQDVMTVTLTSPLSNSTYTVLWNIIGTDGHPIEGNFSFEVNAPETPAEEDQAPQEESQEQEIKETQEGEQGQNEEPAPSQEEEEKGFPLGMIILIGLLLIGAGVSFWLLFRRKNA